MADATKTVRMAIQNGLGPRPGGNASKLNVSANTVIKGTPGTLVRVSVLVAGAAGGVYDCAATADVLAANKVGVIPATVGIYNFTWPCLVGIVYEPGASQVVSISYD